MKKISKWNEKDIFPGNGYVKDGRECIFASIGADSYVILHQAIHSGEYNSKEIVDFLNIDVNNISPLPGYILHSEVKYEWEIDDIYGGNGYIKNDRKCTFISVKGDKYIVYDETEGVFRGLKVSETINRDYIIRPVSKEEMVEWLNSKSHCVPFNSKYNFVNNQYNTVYKDIL